MYQSLDQILLHSAQRFPEKTALVVGDASITYRELDGQSSRLARAIQDLGIQSGDRISLYAANSLEWVIAYYGIIKSGAVVNPLNMGFSPEEAAFAMTDCGASAVIGSASLVRGLLSLSSLASMRQFIAFGEQVDAPMLSLQKMIEGANTDYRPSGAALDDMVAIAYTSGTTGHPKGAMLTHRGMLMNASLAASLHCRTDRDTVVTALPVFHVYGTMVLNAGLLVGMKVVLHAAFDPEAVLASIQAHRATMVEGMPIMYLYMLNHPNQARYDLSSLTRCGVAGQTLSIVKIRQIEERFGCPLLEMWGQTEISGIGTAPTLHGPRKQGSIGVALPHVQIRISDLEDPRKELPDHEVGEIMVRTAMAMKGYFGNPNLTAQAIEPDGWLHTGDLAYRDEEGYLFLVDRRVDMIKVSGKCVYPSEVEHVIVEYPHVDLVGVVGASSASQGEAVKAFVVPTPGTAFEPEKLLIFCRERLEAHQVPTLIQVVSDLPKTPTGKVLRRALRALPEA